MALLLSEKFPESQQNVAYRLKVSLGMTASLHPIVTTIAVK